MSNSSNLSWTSVNASAVGIYRDSFKSTVAKNVLVFALTLVISFINGALVHTYRQHQIFYTNPRYILFIHLVINDTLQVLMAAILFTMSSYFREVISGFCLFLLTVTVPTNHVTQLNLAVMATECYVAVCFPLRHAQLYTVKRTYVLIGGIWVLCTLIILPDVFITVATNPPAFFVSKVYCERANVLGHPIIKLKRDVQNVAYLSGAWLVIVYTYCHIFCAARAAKSSDTESKKIRNTILLHGFQLFLCTLMYFDYLLLKLLCIWFMRYVMHMAFVVFVVIIMLPRLINPILYGLRDKAFRQHLTKGLLLTVIVKA